MSSDKRAAQDEAIRILDSHRIMAVATNRPDGWPQNTIVGYANLGFSIYFVVFRSSQKLANIRTDTRVAIAVGHEPVGLDVLQAVYAGAEAAEVIDQTEKAQAWKLLTERHPNLSGLDLPTAADAAVMRARCRYLSVLDYRVAFGHQVSFELGPPDTSSE
ncbi:pyridoxamine 5'-phosphate oxidase family protein [Sphingomonas daechungensis]|uniref:pyridoxamine 5'-phosphate oxidase family protein n=1 Tax=Sphingomonas daechungensis TaxID=1176646 RepID=UPI003784153B